MMYCNEIDKNAAHWLECLPIKATKIDSMSIKDVQPDDLREFTQCHFFAGIGGWPLALEMAGWPDDAPVWTGSCPCQPFSGAGKRKGTADDRHLWPDWFRLIRECQPKYIFGEQVEGAVGHGWLDLVFGDLEGEGYTCGAAVLGAHSVGAPHIRQRLYWVAYRNGARSLARQQASTSTRYGNSVDTNGSDGRLGDTIKQRSQGFAWNGDNRNQPRRNDTNANGSIAKASDSSGLADTSGEGRCWREPLREQRPSELGRSGEGFWSNVEYIPCRDGKARPVKPGVRLLAHGIPGRVAQLRGLGNAIVPQVATEFIAAFMESQQDTN